MYQWNRPVGDKFLNSGSIHWYYLCFKDPSKSPEDVYFGYVPTPNRPGLRNTSTIPVSLLLPLQFALESDRDCSSRLSVFNSICLYSRCREPYLIHGRVEKDTKEIIIIIKEEYYHTASVRPQSA